MNRRNWFRAATGTLAAVATPSVMITQPKKSVVLGIPTVVCGECGWQAHLIQTLGYPRVAKGVCTNQKCSHYNHEYLVELTEMEVKEVRLHVDSRQDRT